MIIPICVCRDAHRICVYTDMYIHIYAHHAPVLKAKQRNVLDLQRGDELLLQLCHRDGASLGVPRQFAARGLQSPLRLSGNSLL